MKNKRSRRIQSHKKLRKKQKKLVSKEAHAKNTVIEDTEFLSKEQLKKVVKQPTNNIRPSGKRKRKVLKRLRHGEKTKNEMDVEVIDRGNKLKKTKKDKDVELDNDSDDQDMEIMEIS
ncbi:hypothetical protein ACF0H5_021795 [Mactra antiquata]